MAEADAQTEDLFDQLPFRNAKITDDEEKPFACISYIPGIANQLKRTLRKAGVATTFTSGTSLQNILCSKNKTHAPREKKRVFTNTPVNAPIKPSTSDRPIDRVKRAGENTSEQPTKVNGIILALPNTYSIAKSPLTRKTLKLSTQCRIKRKAALPTTCACAKPLRFGVIIQVLARV